MGDKAQEHVEAAYDGEPEREWQRMERHRTEFAVTLRAMDEYLPPAPARVLDVGGGPGRYAIELARRGYEVTLFDLSKGCLEMARDKAAEAGVSLAAVVKGTASDLGRFADGEFDVVLLMGPLYHLIDGEQRRQALAEAVRVLRAGGTLLAAFITRYAVLRWAAVHDPLWPVNSRDEFASVMERGMLPPRGVPGTSFVAWFAHPTEVTPLIAEAGLRLITVLGVEGVVSMIEERVNALDGEAWHTWLDLNYTMAADPSIHGCVEHLLAIARKP